MLTLKNNISKSRNNFKNHNVGHFYCDSLMNKTKILAIEP